MSPLADLSERTEKEFELGVRTVVPLTLEAKGESAACKEG